MTFQDTVVGDQVYLKEKRGLELKWKFFSFVAHAIG
jgi:hypothetical protein